MKHVVKLSLIIFCIALLLGCSGQTGNELEKPVLSVEPVMTTVPTSLNNPSENPQKTTESTAETEAPAPVTPEPYGQEDVVFEFTSISPFFDENAEFMGYNYSNDYAKWSEEIESRFGIELEVTDLYELSRDTFIYYSSDRSNIYENIKTYILNDTIKGLFRIGAPTYLTKLVRDDLILPLDQYLESNLNWQSMPEDYKEAFKIDGVTYGIPSGFYDKAYSRFIRKDWLDKYGIDMPATVDEFYYAAKKFTYDDPDGDGMKNTSGFTHYGTSGLEDIFSSYNVRMNPDGKNFVTWNPNTEVWEDGMIKPEMTECMEFLRSCRIENVLSKNTYIDRKAQFERGVTGSFCSFSSYYYELAAEIKKNSPEAAEPIIDFIPAMSHLINKNITGYYTNYHSSVVLTENSKYPKSTINTFIDVFITDKAGFLLGRYGPEGEGFRMIDDLLIYKTFEEEGRQYSYQGPMISYQSPMVTDYKKVSDYIYDSGTYDDSMHDSAASRDRMAVIKANPMIYKIPWKVAFPDYTETTVSRLGDLETKTRAMVNDVLGGMMSFEDALTEYKYLAKTIGMQEFINEQNEKLGITSGPSY